MTNVGPQTKKITSADVDPPDFGQLQSLTANISRADWYTKNRWPTWSTSIPAGFSGKIFGEIWSTNNKVTATDVDPP